ncbi:HDOD domain-containing protein [Desulfoluna butyratoxydans]|uniref:Metal-dependent hydrolase hdod n=1 Tax=Desulfoluna butyratoxydans TaxID=231438 RepID=A0A4U8YWP6_9BACT|nr:HDOD domain-containing protein [Desulfoluna butyratoxydans]VFQ46452.1 metal-dependent hydrolase hdod [Desulfoluna butyratoxydans]
MNITCAHCSKTYRISDDLVHQICRIQLMCTACGSAIAIEPQILSEEALQAHPSGAALRQEVVENLKKLYPMPHILLKARTLLSGQKNFKELEHLLNTDPALAGRVLKIANSAYYGMSGKVSSIQMAATVLGTDTLLQIITLVGYSKMLGRTLEGYGLDSGELWKHSLAVAICARLIEETLQAKNGDDAFLAGLMHDAGKIILDTYIQDRQQLFSRYTHLTHASTTATEEKILEFTHADIGGELCRKWNLPETMATAIQYHHTPADSGGNRLAYVLNLADHMAKGLSTAVDEPPDHLKETLAYLPIPEIALKDLSRKAQDALESLEEDTY